jgi:glycosyltransferase involved in cell wall biosynthesis
MLLRSLQAQRTDQRFTYSVVVVDNDQARSAEPIVRAVVARATSRVDYYVEGERNIALARNKAVASAVGDYVAFVDDDEVPVDDWLLKLYETSRAYGADAVLGPVKPEYAAQPPAWLLKGRLLDRPGYPTGTVLPWNLTRTGNVLLLKRVFDEGRTMFRPEFRHSEDQDFFKRVIANGRLVVWCDEAIVHEIQGTERFSVGYFIRRALLRGNVSLRLHTNKPVAIVKSAVAFPLYTLALPILAIIRRDLAIAYLIKDFDHIGRLMAACKIDVQKRLA